MYSFSRSGNNLVLLSAILCLLLMSGVEVTTTSQFIDTEEINTIVPFNEFSIDNGFALIIKETLVEVPSDVDVGTVRRMPKLSFAWNTFKLLWHFRKARVSDAWFVDIIQFSYNTSEQILQGRGFEDLPVLVHGIRSPDPFTLWLTPIGESYTCGIAQEVKILDSKKYGKMTIALRHIQIQPFTEMTKREFGYAFSCPEEAGHQNDTVPVVTASLLALTVISTVLGYLTYIRYFKVKKVEYQECDNKMLL